MAQPIEVWYFGILNGPRIRAPAAGAPERGSIGSSFVDFLTAGNLEMQF